MRISVVSQKAGLRGKGPALVDTGWSVSRCSGLMSVRAFHIWYAVGLSRQRRGRFKDGLIELHGPRRHGFQTELFLCPASPCDTEGMAQAGIIEQAIESSCK